jgi:tRNA threonylcarbamoyladenosine biosynthesis protein TsaB
MSYYLVLTSDYDTTQIALYQGNTQKALMSDESHHSSKNLVPLIKTIMEQEKISLHSLDFIGATQGPGKFTSLRVLLATANGLSFACNIPLVGIDGLVTLLDETHTPNNCTVALLNAFNNDLFFGIADNDKPYRTGYKNINMLLEELKAFNKPIIFIGGGVKMYKGHIKAILGNDALFLNNAPEYASLSFCAKAAYNSFKKGETSDQLMPLYLKKPHYKKAIIENG